MFQSLEFMILAPVFLLSLLVFLYYHYRLSPSPPALFFKGLLIGHRGSNMSKHPEKFATGHPENTLEAMRFAMERGVDAIEFDITLSKEGVPIIMHDDTVTRMCVPYDPKGEAPVNLSDRPSQLTVDQMKKFYRYRSDVSTPESDQSHRIPTLREALELTQKKGYPFKLMIEVKACSDFNKMAEKLSKLFEEFDLYERAVVGSFHPSVLYFVRSINPRIVTLLLVKNWIFSSTWSPLVLVEQLQEQLLHLCEMTWMPSFLGVGVIGFDKRLWELGKFDIDRWSERGYVLNCWTVNSEKDKEVLLDKKVSVTTDFLFRTE